MFIRMLLLPLVAALVSFVVSLSMSVAQEPLTISGTVWHDRDFDGVRDPEDEPADVSVSIVGTGQFARPGTRQFARPDVTGGYTFSGLVPGTYRLQLFLAAGSTYPARITNGNVEASITLNASVDNVDFGIVLPNDLLNIRGTAWTSGQPLPSNSPQGAMGIRAFVGERDCTVAMPNAILPSDQPRGSYLLSIAPDGLIPGCGTPGAIVRFTINGVAANETLVWQANPPPPVGSPILGTTLVSLTLTSGPRFALYTGSSLYQPSRPADAFINGADCGEVYDTFGGFILVVLPEALRPSCAIEGSKIDLTVGGVAVTTDLRWSPGSITQLDLLALLSSAEQKPTATTPGTSITPPTAGDAGLASKTLGQTPY